MLATTIFYLFCIFFRAFECIPREKIWNPSIPGTCHDSHIELVVTAAFNAVNDLVILILPISSVWRLQMSTQRKIGISAVFATGLLYHPIRHQGFGLADP